MNVQLCIILTLLNALAATAVAQTKPTSRGGDRLQTPTFWLQQAERHIGKVNDSSGRLRADLAAAYAAVGDAHQFRKHAVALDAPADVNAQDARIEALAVLAGGYGLLGDVEGMNRAIDLTLNAPPGLGPTPLPRKRWLFHTLSGGRQVKSALSMVEGVNAQQHEVDRINTAAQMFVEARLAARLGRRNDYQQLLAGAKRCAGSDPDMALLWLSSEAEVRIAAKDYAEARKIAAPLKDDFKAYIYAQIAEAQLDDGDAKGSENSLRQAFAAASRFKYGESDWPYVNVMARVRAASGGTVPPQLLEPRGLNHEDPRFDVAEGYAKAGNAQAFFDALDLAEKHIAARDTDRLHARNRYSDLYFRMGHWFLLRGDAASAAQIFDRVPAEHQHLFSLRAVNAAARARLGQFQAVSEMLKDGNNASLGGPYLGRVLVRDPVGAAALHKALEHISPLASLHASIGAVQYLTRTWVETDRTWSWHFL